MYLPNWTETFNRGPFPQQQRDPLIQGFGVLLREIDLFFRYPAWKKLIKPEEVIDQRRPVSDEHRRDRKHFGCVAIFPCKSGAPVVQPEKGPERKLVHPNWTEK